MTEKEGNRNREEGLGYIRAENGIHWRRSELLGFLGVPIDDFVYDLEKVVKFTKNYRNLLLEEKGDPTACTFPYFEKNNIESQDHVLFLPLDEAVMKKHGKEGLLDSFKKGHRFEVTGEEADTRILVVPVDKNVVKDLAADINELLEMDREEAKGGYITDPFTNISYHPKVLMDPKGENFENDLKKARERRLKKKKKDQE